MECDSVFLLHCHLTLDSEASDRIIISTSGFSLQVYEANDYETCHVTLINVVRGRVNADSFVTIAK